MTVTAQPLAVHPAGAWSSGLLNFPNLFGVGTLPYPSIVPMLFGLTLLVGARRKGGRVVGAVDLAYITTFLCMDGPLGHQPSALTEGSALGAAVTVRSWAMEPEYRRIVLRPPAGGVFAVRPRTDI